jgi:hypothetical protein
VLARPESPQNSLKVSAVAVCAGPANIETTGKCHSLHARLVCHGSKLGPKSWCMAPVRLRLIRSLIKLFSATQRRATAVRCNVHHTRLSSRLSDGLGVPVTASPGPLWAQRLFAPHLSHPGAATSCLVFSELLRSEPTPSRPRQSRPHRRPRRPFHRLAPERERERSRARECLCSFAPSFVRPFAPQAHLARDPVPLAADPPPDPRTTAGYTPRRPKPTAEIMSKGCSTPCLATYKSAACRQVSNHFPKAP